MYDNELSVVGQMVVARIDRLEAKLDQAIMETHLCRVEIGKLQVKAGVWGFMAGLIPPLVGLAMWAISVAP